MTEQNYQNIAGDLIADAGRRSHEQSLDDQAVFDSVEKLCRSSKGAQYFVDETPKIDKNITKNRLIASLNWVKDTAETAAASMDLKVEIIKPFQLAAIGLTVADIIWLVQNSQIAGFEYYFLVTLVLYVILITFVRILCSLKRDKNVSLSRSTSSLLDIMSNVCPDCMNGLTKKRSE